MIAIKRTLFSISALLTVLLIQKADLYREIQQTPDSKLLKNNSRIQLLSSIPTFGFRNIVSDYLFLQFLVYFGNEREETLIDYSDSPIFFDRIISLDPYFRDFYLFLSQSTSVHAGKPHEAVSIMNDGLQKLQPNHPSDGYHIWRYKGVDEILFLGDSQAAKESFETSASWAAVSSELDSKTIEESSRKTAKFIATNPDSRKVQISAWASVITSAIDDETRMRAVREIESLGGSVIFGDNGAIRIEASPLPQVNLAEPLPTS